MFLKSLIWGGVAGLAVLSAGPASAQSLNAQDRKFIENAAKGGMMEVHMGQKAMEQGQSADVKSFGQRMVTDHGKANMELMDLAKKKGVALPAENASDVPAKLNGKSGKDFDTVYSKMMVEDHVKDIAEFEKEAKSGGDADVKEWANKTLPTLRSHLDAAKALKPVN